MLMSLGSRLVIYFILNNWSIVLFFLLRLAKFLRIFCTIANAILC